MAFSKLFIIFALTAFVRPEIIKFQKFSLEGSDTIVWDKRGIDQGWFSIDTDDGVLPWTNSSSSTKLSVLPSSFTSVSQFAIYHVFDYTKQCEGPYYYYDERQFDLEAIAALAYYSQNIVPSGLHLFNCHPKQLKTLTDENPSGTTASYVTGCSLGYSTAAILKGIASEDCYGASGSYGGICRTQCLDGSAMETYGSSLRITSIENSSGITETQLRKLIARFGPVLAYNSHYNRYQIYYGWNSDFGSLMYQTLYRVDTGDLKQQYESISPWPLITDPIFFVQPPADCTSSEIPKYGCKCTSTNNPNGCICPTTPSDLLNIPETKCSCIANDQRASCKICKGQTSDATDCICPTTPTGLLNIPKSKCPCIANDQRGSCKTCTGAVGEASDCICPTTPYGLQNVPKSKCPCISGDLRSDCQPEKCTSSQKPLQGCICSGSYTPTGCTCPTVGADTQGLSTGLCNCIKDDVRNQCQPTQCTSSTVPQQGCICSQTASPSGCTCPDDPQDLVGIPEYRCQCQDESIDPRGPCQTCTGSQSDASDCICPTTPQSLQQISPDKCECIYGDLRPGCQPTQCKSFFNIPQQGCICFGSYAPPGCICPQTADELVGMSPDKCGCIYGDLRPGCQPTKCTSYYNVPQQGCICTKDYYPNGCICPTTASSIEYISTDICDCISGDKREDCQEAEPTEDDCTSITSSTPLDVCKCRLKGDPRQACQTPVIPTTDDCARVTRDTPEKVCKCPAEGSDEYERDPRHQTKGDICASGSIRAILSVVVVAVMIPILALLW